MIDLDPYHAREKGAGSPLIEVLYFEGCPNHEPTVSLLEQTAEQLGLQPEFQMIEVLDGEAATRQRFLGSPTVRIHGEDIEPGAGSRTDFGFTCRVFRTHEGTSPTPDRQWVVDALLRPHALEALGAAGIPLARTGASRTARLDSRTGELYRGIMRAFSEGRPPTRADFSADLDASFGSLADEDLVHLGDDGAIDVAYPFAGKHTAHTVRIESNDPAQAMCAIDALGMSAMFDGKVEIESLDPVTGQTIRVHAQPGQPTTWEPVTAVVLAGRISCDGPAHCNCCEVLNFFATPENAHDYLNTHPEVTGYPVAIPVAESAGRIIFGDALR